MHIHGPMHLHAAQSINPPHRLRAAYEAAAPAANRGADQLDISPQAEFLSRIRDIPDIRADRVAQIREQIEAGVYETANKLDVALDRLLDEIA
jgi:negative regulator of flagellin synthesis FlgM